MFGCPPAGTRKQRSKLVEGERRCSISRNDKGFLGGGGRIAESQSSIRYAGLVNHEIMGGETSGGLSRRKVECRGIWMEKGKRVKDPAYGKKGSDIGKVLT